MADADEEWRKLPVDEKVVHKLWKARVSFLLEISCNLTYFYLVGWI